MIKETVTLSQGSGGKAMQELIQEVFLKEFTHPALAALTDAAMVPLPSWREYRLGFTTDSYVVKPLFFPGGDIGKLACCGTINDLAVSGARPLFLACSFILEEGLSLEVLKRIVHSVKTISEKTGVPVVTGDTKVVEKGKVDGVFVTTTGVGIISEKVRLDRKNIQPGDRIIVSGPLGEHEMAVLLARGDFQLEAKIVSDCAPLHSLTAEVLKVEPHTRFMRDPTRGGLAAVLNEIVAGLKFGILLKEEEIPLKKEVAALCEILGLDPMWLASEGRLVAVVAEQSCSKVISCMKKHRLGRQARVIGEVIEEEPGRVVMKTISGSTRLVDMPSGVQRPRIC
ncbi:MAG: hydrogenase expression/formation protein HypE [Candidatus Omnitrophica bacterium]|nr:hydrogenase expression/formation protein HypE [Candidatus Omnitrophota bacterium]